MKKTNDYLSLTATLRRAGETLTPYSSDCINETEAINLLQGQRERGYKVEGAWIDGIWFERFFEEFNFTVNA